MSREPIETYPQANFDHEGHIAEFLHTSAVYLGVDADHITALTCRAWQPQPAILSQEVQHA